MQKFDADDAPPSPRPSPKTALNLIKLAACDDDLRKNDTKYPCLSRASTREAVRAAPSPLSRKARSLDYDEHSFHLDDLNDLGLGLARPVPHRPKFLSVPGGVRTETARAGHGHVGSRSLP